MGPTLRAVQAAGVLDDGYTTLATTCMLPALPRYVAGGRRRARAPTETYRVFYGQPTAN